MKHMPVIPWISSVTFALRKAYLLLEPNPEKGVIAEYDSFRNPIRDEADEDADKFVQARHAEAETRKPFVSVTFDVARLPPDLESREFTLQVGSTRFAVPSGVLCVVGGSATGKTTLLRILNVSADSEGYAVSSFGYREPEFVFGRLPLVSEMDLARSLGYWFLDADQHIALLDSLRTTIFTIPGNATAKGISAGTYDLLTELDIAAKTAGKLLIVVINPQVSDPDTVRAFKEAVLGSVGSLIVCREPGQIELSSRLAVSRSYQEIRVPAPDNKRVAAARVPSDAFASRLTPLSTANIAALFSTTTRK